VIVHDLSIDTVNQMTRHNLATIPSGHWHRNDAPSGVTILHLTPTEGNQHSWQRPRTG
jgi:hypothetical protein